MADYEMKPGEIIWQYRSPLVKEHAMAYEYEDIKPQIFLEENQELFLGVRDQVKKILRASGAITLVKACQLPDGIGAADGWLLIACVHRLVELGELEEVSRDIFIKGNGK